MSQAFDSIAEPYNEELIPCAYHEAAHAVIGHIIGRCIQAISILSSKERGYRGFCVFDSQAELWNGHPQWHSSQCNPELITIFYAGPIATALVCARHGWNYKDWRGGERSDRYYINRLARQITEDKQQRAALKKAHQKQAEEMVNNYYSVIDVLAAHLLIEGQLPGKDAHEIIREELGETEPDWRLTV